jgi:hypothetical protein
VRKKLCTEKYWGGRHEGAADLFGRENAWPGGTYVDFASIAGAIPASFLSIDSR